MCDQDLYVIIIFLDVTVKHVLSMKNDPNINV